MRKISQVKAGIIISYALIIVNTLYTLIITPYIISCIGAGEFGVYKTISSLTASLIVIDLGIGGTVQRYVAKYRADQEEARIPNFLAMNYILAAILSLVLVIVCIALFFALDPVYGDTFDSSQLRTAKIVFTIMSISLVLQFFGDVANGAIVGYNRFFFGNGIKLLKIVIRIILVYVLLNVFRSAITLALVDLSLTIAVIIAQQIYISRVLRVPIKYEVWNKSVFFESGKYTILMFLTTIVSQLNSNVDNIIIGAISGPDFVAIYSIGVLFFGMFQSISAAVAGVMLPTITNILVRPNNEKKLVGTIIQVGRLQFLLIGACIVGFIFVGRDFIDIWLGKGFEDAYVITLVLVVPSIFELCINGCLSILRAQNRLVFRTIAISISTILNVIITIIAVKNWSYIGASFGTAFSYIACSLVAMNIYYSKIIGLPMLEIYRGIVKGIWICLMAGGITLFFTSQFFYGSYISLIINIIAFGIVYLITLILFGLNKDEKQMIPLLR